MERIETINLKTETDALEAGHGITYDELRGADMLANARKRLENEMFEHAKNLEFEKASEVRDKLASIRKQVFGATPGKDEEGAKENV